MFDFILSIWSICRTRCTLVNVDTVHCTPLCVALGNAWQETGLQETWILGAGVPAFKLPFICDEHCVHVLSFPRVIAGGLAAPGQTSSPMRPARETKKREQQLPRRARTMRRSGTPCRGMDGGKREGIGDVTKSSFTDCSTMVEEPFSQEEGARMRSMRSTAVEYEQSKVVLDSAPSAESSVCVGLSMDPSEVRILRMPHAWGLRCQRKVTVLKLVFRHSLLVLTSHKPRARLLNEGFPVCWVTQHRKSIGFGPNLGPKWMLNPHFDKCFPNLELNASVQ